MTRHRKDSSGEPSTLVTESRDAQGAGSSIARKKPHSPEVFVDFFRLFAAPPVNEKLFPKECHTCRRRFPNFVHYLDSTLPKGHVMEDCSDVMEQPYTMMYRHCPCGNTLITVFTDETIPFLDRMWEMLGKEAERSGVPFKELVREFSIQLDRYMKNRREQHGPSPADS